MRFSREDIENEFKRALKNPEQACNSSESLSRMLEVFKWENYSAETMRWKCTCSCLIKNKDGSYYCKEYDKRPDVCRDYPGKKIEFKRCIYWNKDVLSLKDGISQLVGFDRGKKLSKG